mmetsp:Transcript_28146/g.43140  ORF Transcript_28146/g.43140 Transcript_28146/m.43140 type:complete len:174 (+) Transcript_28146:140-661(+)
MLSLSGKTIVRRSFQLRVVTQQRWLTTTGTGICNTRTRIRCATTTNAAADASTCRSRMIGITPRAFTSNIDIETFPALEKLRKVLEEYRKANFSQTLPSRSTKQILEALDEDKDGFVTSTELQHFLENINASEEVSPEELDEIVTKLDSGSHKGISIQDIMERYKKQGHKAGW